MQPAPDSLPPRVFESTRLILRAPEMTDAEAIFQEYAQDPEVTRYLSWRPHASVDVTREFIALCQRGWESGELWSWTISLKTDARVIGMISAAHQKFKCMLGYVLARRAWGQAIMPEATQLVIDWAMAQPAIYRVYAFHDIDNPSSGRVMEKVGMKREAELSRWHITPNVSSEPRDCVFYGITK